MIGNIVAGLYDPGVIEVGDFESIATVTVGAGGAAEVNFTNISSVYQHLQIRYTANDETNADAVMTMRVGNGSIDTGSNYTRHGFGGTGATTFTVATANATSIAFSYALGNASARYGVGVIDILDYNDTNKFKTIRNLFGADNNGSGYMSFYSGLWRSTSAITHIRFTAETDIREYSHFALYGIKG